MDIAIRVANMLMAVDILVGAGLDPGHSIVDIVLGSARDHADHIADHLEWSEQGRSNHYLANLVGLLWAASHLAPDRRTDAMLAFAAAELLREGDRQFGADGGNYEGSTNYHRLSGELMLFGVALLAGLRQDDLERLDNARTDALQMRVPWRAGPLPRYLLPNGGMTIVPPALREKLFRARELVCAATRPDGRVVQIGDTDSGRLFKLTPIGRSEDGANGRVYCEDPLDHRALVAGIGALFGLLEDARTIDSIAIGRLAHGQTFALPAVQPVKDHGDIDATIQSIASLPAECRRHRYIKFAESIPLDAWRRAAFPDFGLYSFTGDRGFVAFRCAPPPSPEAPLGHTHDDNLAIEYVLGDECRIDPGTYCYTPLRAWRNRYRSADAHDVVRAVNWEVAPPSSELFAIKHTAWARCLAWGATGVAGEIATRHGRLLRALKLTVSGIDIWDGARPPDRLRPVAPPIDVALGYGNLGAQATSSGLI